MEIANQPNQCFTFSMSPVGSICPTFLVFLTLFQAMAVLYAQPAPALPPQPAIVQPLPKDERDEDLQRLTNRVLQLEIDLAKASKSPPESNLTTGIIAGAATLSAALLAGFLTLLGQRFTAKQEERRVILTAERAVELARQEAIFQHTEKILEFRVKQLELFYAPMFALLEQSKALYTKMLHQLVQDEPNRYRLLSEPDPEGYRMHVLAKDGAWKGFRLLDQLPAIRSNLNTLTLVERILQIGEQMTKIISDHAGLASKDLIELLGEYLAHYALLSTIHKRGETVPYEPGWHKMGYYPRQLNGRIEEGYRELSQFVDEYAMASKRMLEALPAAAGKQQ
ncbi:MAG: hypothetical protein L0387_14200 [Acidobacteria bacterium]|nr:hypothetical protein [Acidobacteriota bacterium]